MANKTLNVGLIGCGDISKAHLKTYPAVGLNVVAICDVDAARAENRKKEFGLERAEVMSDYRKLVRRDDVDIVTVATPVALHAPMTLAALEAGKHVACEKPSTLDVNENRAIVAAAEKAGRKVIFFSSRMRWGAAVMARQYIQDGEVGEIYRVDVTHYRSRGRPGVDIIKEARWFANKKLAGGGMLMDMGQYFMDMVFHLTGWPVVSSVSASTWKGFPHDLPAEAVYDVEEHATILARAAKATFTFDLANIANHKPVRRITILGTRGGIVMDDDNYFSYFTEKGGPWRQTTHRTDWRDNTDGNNHIYAELIQAIQENDPGIGTTPREALAITEITQMAYRSAAEGREVRREEII
jgi:predicted dehydrogenase